MSSVIYTHTSGVRLDSRYPELSQTKYNYGINCSIIAACILVLSEVLVDMERILWIECLYIFLQKEFQSKSYQSFYGVGVQVKTHNAFTYAETQYDVMSERIKLSKNNKNR